MAYSYIKVTAAAGQTSVPFSFDYLATSEIKVKVNDVETTAWSLSSPNVVALDTAMSGGEIIEIERVTNLTTRVVDFASGAVLTEEDLDLSAQQVFNAAQEALDSTEKNLSETFNGQYDAKNKRIVNIADGVDPQDAITMSQLEYEYPAVLNVSNNMTDVNTVGTNITNVNKVADIDANVTTVSGISTDVTAVANNQSNINNVVSNESNVNTVATNIADVATVAANVTDVTNFADVYYGPSATAPTTRRDGSALQAGDLWFDTANGYIKVYTGELLSWRADLLGPKQYSSTVSMKNDSIISAGQVVETLEHTIGYGYEGGNRYLARTVTAAGDDNGSIIKSTANPNIEFIALFQKGVNPLHFGADKHGINDSTVALQTFFDFSVNVASRDRRPKFSLTDGKFLFTSLNISDVGAETGGTNGRIRVEGAGQINTQLVCTSPSADAVKISSGRVELSGFTLSSDGVNRSATIGSGAGLVIDKTDGVTPDSVTVSKFRLHDIQVLGQPGHGVVGINLELASMNDITSDENGGDGFYLDGSNYGGNIKGISNLFTNCRARLNTGRGLSVISASECTFINLQCLNNDADQQVFSNGRNSVFINPDIENPYGASHLVGMELAGRNSKVEGGLVFGFTTGIKLTGNGQSVDGTYLLNSTLAYDMDVAVDVISATQYRVNIDKEDPTTRKVIKAIKPIAVTNGGSQNIGGVVSVSSQAGRVKEFTITTSTAFPLGDDGQGGSGVIGSQVYYVSLQSNAVIQEPLDMKPGQELEVIFVQDATGGRAVTFSGAQWVVNFSNTGNAAGTTSSVRFRRHYDSASASVKFIQIGAQMPWT